MATCSNNLLTKASAGELCKLFGIKLSGNTSVVQLAKNAGFDALFIDMEHSTLSIEDVSQLCCAGLLGGITPFVRVPFQCGDGFVQRVLDGGAMGVIFPHVHSRKDAQAAVSISKYPPMGTRSMTGQLPVFSLRPTPQEQVINETNTSASSVILMIETKGAIDEIDEITSTPGADVILIGSNDLAIELGVPGGFTTPVFRSALEAVSEACRKHDKVMGLAGVYDNHDFQDWAVNTLGVRFMLVGLDAAIIAKGAVGCINAVSKVEKSKVTGVA